MNIQIVEKHGKKYAKGISGQKIIENERDVVDIIGFCGEHNIRQIMLHAENLTEHFFDLKSRQAGMILQKFVTYQVQVAIVLSLDYMKQGKFREMVVEANQGKHFRIFHDRDEAEAWLMRNYSD
jgi:hypothetical protein